MPAATNSTTATITAAAQTGSTSANAATPAAIKVARPRTDNRPGDADQPGADACMLDRFLQLFLCQPHLIADEA